MKNWHYALIVGALIAAGLTLYFVFGNKSPKDQPKPGENERGTGTGEDEQDAVNEAVQRSGGYGGGGGGSDGPPINPVTGNPVVAIIPRIPVNTIAATIIKNNPNITPSKIIVGPSPIISVKPRTQTLIISKPPLRVVTTTTNKTASRG